MKPEKPSYYIYRPDTEKRHKSAQQNRSHHGKLSREQFEEEEHKSEGHKKT